MPDLLAALATPDDTSTSFLNPTLLSQADALARRKALLQQQALDSAKQLGIYAPPTAPQEQPGWTSAVTGARMVGAQPRESIFAAATPLIANAMRELREKKYDEDLSGYNRVESGAAQEHLLSKPDDSAPQQAKLAWAQKGMDVPALAPVMKAYVEDEIVKAPDRRAAKAWEQAKFTLEQNDKAATRTETNRHNVAMENKPPTPNIVAVTDNYGNVRGWDTKAGAFVGSQQGSGGPATGSPGGAPTLGPGKPSGAVEKQIADAGDRNRQAVNSISRLQDAKKLLENTIHGPIDAAKEAARNAGVPFFGSTTERDDNASSLDATAQWLAAEFPRGPGSISDSERTMFMKASGDLANRMKDPKVRSAAADTVMRLIAKSAGLPDPTAEKSLRETISGLMEDNSEPVGRFTGDPSRAIAAMTDPVERARAQRAWANQQAGKGPKELTFNPKTGRLE